MDMKHVSISWTWTGIFDGRPAFPFDTGGHPRNCVRVRVRVRFLPLLLEGPEFFKVLYTAYISSYFLHIFHIFLHISFIFPSYFFIFSTYFFIFPSYFFIFSSYFSTFPSYFVIFPHISSFFLCPLYRGFRT